MQYLFNHQGKSDNCVLNLSDKHFWVYWKSVPSSLLCLLTHQPGATKLQVKHSAWPLTWPSLATQRLAFTSSGVCKYPQSTEGSLRIYPLYLALYSYLWTGLSHASSVSAGHASGGTWSVCHACAWWVVLSAFHSIPALASTCPVQGLSEGWRRKGRDGGKMWRKKSKPE